MMKKTFLNTWVLLVGLSSLIAGCSQDSVKSGGTAGSFASTGQVSGAGTANVSAYAAARFADQASFGASPATVAAVQSLGFEAWIDQQFALPPSQVDVKPFLDFRDPTLKSVDYAYRESFIQLAVGSEDQLRVRVAWALSQFIVVSDRGTDIYAMPFWMNMLLRNALGRYDELLYDVSVSPAMGNYLNNNQNRPKSAECPHCAPNENFARELMQLFSLGVVKLTPDGQAIRNPDGSFAETYSQRDVEELARVLTGWQFDPNPSNRPNRNHGNWAKNMVPSTWPPERDSGSKVVLGTVFPANQTQEKDLRDAINMLMSHPNIAPFVAQRLIQHLVKSDPTPAFVGRIASVFRDNGKGVRGDLKAVTRAILLDEESRRGDDPTKIYSNDGKLREPFLQLTATWRGMGCRVAPRKPWGVDLPQTQTPFSAESVFSFYAPTDRAPGSNILSPEQRIINTTELAGRLSRTWHVMRWDSEKQTNTLDDLRAADCGIDKLVDAYAKAPSEFVRVLSDRYFRGAMPYVLRYDIEQLISRPQWNTDSPEQGALRMIDYALSSPYFGAMR